MFILLAMAISEPPDMNRHTFANLRKVTCRGYEGLVSFNEVLPFFFIPSVETLLVDRCRDKHAYLDLDRNRKRSYYPRPKLGASVSSLSLEQSVFQPKVLKGIIQSCPALRSFTISLYDDNCDEGMEEHLQLLDPPLICEALHSARNSLVNLKLAISGFEYYEEGMAGIQPIALRRLEVLDLCDFYQEVKGFLDWEGVVQEEGLVVAAFAKAGIILKT